MGDTKFTFIDLFAGIGGFKMALSNNGGECKGFSEINKDAITTYCDNYGIKEEHNYGDITKIKELPTHDILTAGVPCQSWSIAGKNLGFDDDRGQLWNDTIYLLQQSKPKAFIFENVKGLVDPRNKEALSYILDRIKEAGYFADFFVINSLDYGVPQNRIRIYIIGFREEKYFEKLSIPTSSLKKQSLGEILGISKKEAVLQEQVVQTDLFGNQLTSSKSMSLSSKNGFNDYFLFNDLRNGHTTIHSWDILDTSDKQKDICLLLLKNRRKSAYGSFDGNPLSYQHFNTLESSIEQHDLDELVKLSILKEVEFVFEISPINDVDLSKEEQEILENVKEGKLYLEDLKTNRDLKLHKVPINSCIQSLKEKNVIKCIEVRYDFKNTKISTGLFGINRIFLPTADTFPTLVASDTNDFITTKTIKAPNHEEYKRKFLEDVYQTEDYRKITKSEACIIQGFPSGFKLPDSRARWMKLVGNSVSVPVIDILCKAIIKTGVLNEK